MTLETTLAEFRTASRRGGIVPVASEFAADTLTPITTFSLIRNDPFGFLLESLVGGERWARYTFAGTSPREAWSYSGGRAHRWTEEEGWVPAGEAPDPLDHIGRRMRELDRVEGARDLPPFTGGAVGYLGYDCVRAIERLPEAPPDDLQLPDAFFLITDTLVIIDNAFGRAFALSCAHVAADAGPDEVKRAWVAARDRIGNTIERLGRPAEFEQISLVDREVGAGTSPYEPEQFTRDVARLKDHIAAGDIFQAVLSRRIDVESTSDPFKVYRCLRALNPAPYLYFLSLGDLSVAGSSPEVLVRVTGDEATVRPIAGTRARGSTPEEDEALARDLLADRKELAEHAMLVDLGRNDLGRVAAYGSVRLTDDKVVERYSHVQHIVSEVRATLKPGVDGVDALRACFPAGTVSGAPKVRAMELIDSLEPTRRGPYAGAVCYISWGARNIDTAITIRTAILRNGKAHVQAGAGIVADSDPERELEETENKAMAVLKAIAMARD